MFRQRHSIRQVETWEKIRLPQTNCKFEEDRGEGSGPKGTCKDKQDPEQGNLQSHIHVEELGFYPCRSQGALAVFRRSRVWEPDRCPDLQGLKGDLPGPCLSTSSPGKGSLWEGCGHLWPGHMKEKKEVVLNFLSFASSIIISLKKPEERKNSKWPLQDP